MLTFYRHFRLLSFFRLSVFFLSFGCVSVSVPEDFAVIDCQLPGQIRQLGRHATFVTARRYMKTTRETCADRGGEQNITLKKLEQLAEESRDPEIQYSLGTNYEKGSEGEPNYELAARWYRRAADQGYARAAINLGRLYEEGLGVPQSRIEAFEWYAKASGFKESSNLGMLVTPQMRIQAKRKIRELENKLAEKEKEILVLRKNLNSLNTELDLLQSQLKNQTSLLDEEHRKLQRQEQQYQTLKAELKKNLGKADRASEVSSLQLKVNTLKTTIEQRQQQLQGRNKKMALLQKTITMLESKMEKQSKALTHAKPVDLGVDGPSIEIIEPQLNRMRGVQTVEDSGEAVLSMNSGGRQNFTGKITAPAGLRVLRVNSEIIEVDNEGNFTAPLPIHGPQNSGRLQIVALDIQDKHDSLIVDVKHEDTDAPDPPPQDMTVFGNYHALVIGNDHYEDKKHWPSLHNAIADAMAVKKVLEERYKFQVTLLKDATGLKILKALNNYREALTKKDNLLIYYAGHGALQKEIDRGYWIPVDAEGKDNSKWISLSVIRDQLGLIPAKHIMIVADSCFAGKLTRDAQGKLRPGLSEDDKMEVYKILAQNPVRTAMTSGGIKPVLDTGENQGHSVFAEAFVGVLKNNRTIIEAEHVFLAVRGRVLPISKRLNFVQLPTYNPIHMAGHESLGDFIFVPYLRG